MAVMLPFLFLAAGTVKAWPFVDDVAVNLGDDWVSYKIYAQTILSEGPAMPSIGSFVGMVHGFGYSYFVAAIFSLFGENSAYVYIVQSALLGASITALYLLGRPHLSPMGRLAFVIAGTAFVYLDVFRNITFRLLPEDLFVFLAPVFLLTFVTAHERGSRNLAVLSGAALGALVLVRPNALVAGVAVVAAGWLSRAIQRRDFATPAIVTGMLLLIAAAYPLREYVVIGRPHLELWNPSGNFDQIPTDSPLAFLEYYVRRALFTLGFTNAVEPGYRWRPHWLLLWLTFFIYVGWRLRLRRIPFWEVCTVLFLVLYLGPVLAVSFPSNYGGRFLVVALPIALLLGVVVIDAFLRRSDALDRARAI